MYTQKPSDADPVVSFEVLLPRNSSTGGYSYITRFKNIHQSGAVSYVDLENIEDECITVLYFNELLDRHRGDGGPAQFTYAKRGGEWVVADADWMEDDVHLQTLWFHESGEIQMLGLLEEGESEMKYSMDPADFTPFSVEQVVMMSGVQPSLSDA